MAGKSSSSTVARPKRISSSTKGITSGKGSPPTFDQRLEDFVAELRQDANKFERYWVRKNKENPSQFPMQMGGGDWFEQFLAWCELTGEEP